MRSSSIDNFDSWEQLTEFELSLYNPRENKDLYNAVFLVYIPSLDKVEKISKTILVNSKMYKIGTYYECKYLQNEINITGFNPDVKNIPGSPLLLEEKFTEYINNI